MSDGPRGKRGSIFCFFHLPISVNLNKNSALFHEDSDFVQRLPLYLVELGLGAPKGANCIQIMWVSLDRLLPGDGSNTRESVRFLIVFNPGADHASFCHRVPGCIGQRIRNCATQSCTCYKEGTRLFTQNLR